MIDGDPYKFRSLPKDKRHQIEQTRLIAYVCEGSESEIKEWFKIINMGGVKINDQETRNAIYSGPFVTAARKEFSNKEDSRL